MRMRPNTRHVVLTGAALVGVSTAATSAVSLFELAVLCGIPSPLAAALPIALDAGAGVAALVWITERGELRSWGRGIALAALTATLVGNGLAHAITAGLLAVTLPLVLTVGACIPGMLFAVVHLAALMARPTPVAPRAQRPAKAQPATTSVPTVADAVEAAETVPADLASKPTDLASRPTELASKQAEATTAKDWARANFPCTAKQIEIATGVAKGSAHRIRNQVAAEREAS